MPTNKEIEELFELKKQGAITEEEFETRKKALIKLASEEAEKTKASLKESKKDKKAKFSILSFIISLIVVFLVVMNVLEFFGIFSFYSIFGADLKIIFEKIAIPLIWCGATSSMFLGNMGMESKKNFLSAIGFIISFLSILAMVVLIVIDLLKAFSIISI